VTNCLRNFILHRVKLLEISLYECLYYRNQNSSYCTTTLLSACFKVSCHGSDSDVTNLERKQGRIRALYLHERPATQILKRRGSETKQF